MPRPLASALFCGLLVATLWPVGIPAQETPPPPTGEQAQDPVRRNPPAEGEERQGPGRRGGEAGEGEQDPEGEGEERPKAPRRGLAVLNTLVTTHCGNCHQQDKEGLMTRISYMRKSPEGWSTTLKRMIRLYEVKIAPEEAKQMVRYLADHHGLTRGEAERGLYESERRVHWSEDHHDQDLRQACAVCHPLGRVLSQQRDTEEWQLLRATHVAYFPLSRGQMGGGPPRSERGRGPGGGMRGMGGMGGIAIPEEVIASAESAAAGGGTGGGGGAGSTSRQGREGATPPAEAGGGGRGRGGGQDRGDRVLAQLAKDLPLFTLEFEKWQQNRREVPIAATWSVTGHEVGRGNLIGTLQLTRTAENEYDTHWRFTFEDGSKVDRSGKGLLYSGYSWRGRATDPGNGGHEWREVLLLDERWRSMRGRVFTGDYDEIGVDVELQRHVGMPRVLAVEQRAMTVPSRDHELLLRGEAFPESVQAADFHLGAGVTVKTCQWESPTMVRLRVDVAPTAENGDRAVAYGVDPGSAKVLLYDSIDYIRVRPLRGMARIGGIKYPKQYERFEAVTVNRGRDGKPYTEDDMDIGTVKATWSLLEFAVREDDDDLKFVGTIDPATGVFTPGVEGPNPERRWQGNNVGDVYVEATVTLDVPVRDEVVDESMEMDEKTGGIPVRKSQTLRARGHLLVTVPKYVRFDQLDWSDQ